MSTNVYQDLEDALYNVVEGLFPTWNIVFPFQNHPEEQTPFLSIDVMKNDPSGREYQSTLVDIINPDDPQSTTLQDYISKVRFEFVGKYDNNTVLASMAQDLDMALRTPKGQELLLRNNLSALQVGAIDRLKARRETETYMYYQQTNFYAWTMRQRSTVDYIEYTDIHGIYHDAGREPDHIIHTYTKIDKPPTEDTP